MYFVYHRSTGLETAHSWPVRPVLFRKFVMRGESRVDYSHPYFSK
jgi:hypothetical protein